MQNSVFKMTDTVKLKTKPSSQEAQSLDLSIRIKAGTWGEEDDHILYLKNLHAARALNAHRIQDNQDTLLKSS